MKTRRPVYHWFRALLIACTFSALALVARPTGAPEASQTGQFTAREISMMALPMAVADLPNWFRFQSQDTVYRWITDCDVKSITLHGWEVWAAVTAATNQEIDGKSVKLLYDKWEGIMEDGS